MNDPASIEAPQLISSLTSVYRTHYAQLLRYCRMRIRNHADAEDIVQDAFLSVRRAYQDKPEDELRALLFTTVRNLAANYLKSGRVRYQRQSEEIGALADEVACRKTPTPEKELMDAQLLAIAEEAIEGMAPRKRDALRMHRIEGLTYEVIAQRLSVSPTTVKTDIAAAIAEIAERLAKAGGDAPGQGR
jgi:RNA polymerase sigma-70 factor (ECF subfamily)